MKLILPLLCLVALTAGCSSTGSKFSCPKPEGVTCLSARDVYHASLGTSTGRGRPAGNHEVIRDPSAGATLVQAPSSPAMMLDGDTLRFGNAFAPPMASQWAVQQENPLRQPARVLRVWIAPWEDAQGNLHGGGYVYSEIEQRRWNSANAEQDL